jgi:hypothetical protein
MLQTLAEMERAEMLQTVVHFNGRVRRFSFEPGEPAGRLRARVLAEAGLDAVAGEFVLFLGGNQQVADYERLEAGLAEQELVLRHVNFSAG